MTAPRVDTRNLGRLAARSIPAASIGGLIVVLAYLHGGYGPSAWGWTALLGLWEAIVALAVSSHGRVDRGGLALLGGLAAVAGWTALSTIWSLSVPRTMLDLERDVAYVAVGAALLLCRRRDDVRLMTALCAGLVLVALYGLGSYFATHPVPDATQGYLLFRPVGYANAFGGLVAMALPLCYAFAAQGKRALAAVAAASANVLLVALYLTQNRAGYLALAVALVVWLVRTNARARAAATTIVLSTPGVLGVGALAALRVFDTSRPAGDVHLLRIGAGLGVAGIALASAALSLRLPALSLSQRAGVRATWICGSVAGLALVLGLADLGNRAQYWRAAWIAFRRHPLLGTGGGTFDEQWLRYRTSGLSVHDAHNLYLETLSELGVVGLAALLVLLALPIVASRRNRDPLLTACVASYVVFLVHAGFEWDWEMPVVTIAGLTLASILVRSRPHPRDLAVRGAGRLTGTVSAAALATVVAVALVGNTAVTAAERQISNGDVQQAGVEALRARTLLPWSPEPWLVLADVRARSHDPGGSRAALAAAVARDGADWTMWFRLAAASHASARNAALRHAVALNPRLFAAGGSHP